MKVLENTGEKSDYESAALPTELRRPAFDSKTRLQFLQTGRHPNVTQRAQRCVNAKLPVESRASPPRLNGRDARSSTRMDYHVVAACYAACANALYSSSDWLGSSTQSV